MLTELHIENLGVIEHVELVFGPGLTALTGETGAGKTMLVEAIELLVGGRADSTSVRHGADEARIDGRVIGLDGTETILTRIVPARGRSRAYLDGRLATVSALADAARSSIELHGQHAHQSLLSTATQRAALDLFGGVDLEELRRARARLTEIDAELAALGGDERARAREIDLLQYQVRELDDADIVDAQEDDRLDREESTLADASAHREAAERAIDVLAGDERARDLIGAAVADLGGRAPFEPLTSRLVDVLAELDDVSAMLRDSLEAIEESPERLSQLRVRRQLLSDLRRKYGARLSDVMQFHREAAERLAELQQHDERAARLDTERRSAIDAERRAALAVGTARRTAAPTLARAVEHELHALAMSDATVAVDVGTHADDHPGDRVQFLLAANAGSPLLPLTRVASGGELARAMLALRLVLSRGRRGDMVGSTLIFDEVDAGIGGAAAHAVAGALESLADRDQVLVVTHLAQVASRSHHHVVVEKSTASGSTTATARVLEGDARVDEIARMLSGSLTSSAREHALELLG